MKKKPDSVTKLISNWLKLNILFLGIKKSSAKNE